MKYATARGIFLPLFRSRLARVEGSENIPTPPYIIAANHADFLDGFFIAAAFWQAKQHPVYFITKTNNYGWTQATIQIDLEQKSDVLDRARRFLQQGKIICNFVEGERNWDATLRAGRTGTVRLALATHVPIVPVGISGAVQANYFLGSLWDVLRGTHRVVVRIGKPRRLSADAEPTNDQLHHQTRELLAAIAPLCGKRPPPPHQPASV